MNSRGVAWPTPRFSDNGDQTLTDNLTGLIWTKNGNPATATKTWQGALDYVASLNSESYLGYSDWRLPNRKELMSLVNRQQGSSAGWLNTQGFSSVRADYYWSSSSNVDSSGYAWVVNLYDGYVDGNSKGKFVYVWPVRGGQGGSLPSLTISPASKDFGGIVTNATSSGQTFTISNNGTANLMVSSIALTGGNSGMFALATGNGTSGTCGATPTMIPVGSCTISATFTPTSAGAKSTTLRIISNDPVTPNRNVPLSGTGMLPTYIIGTSVVGGHGSITCDSPVISGTTSHCAISPDAGYHLATFTDNTVNKLASVVANAYSIPSVTANHAIAGTFAIDFHTVSFNSNGGSAVASQHVAYNGTAIAPVAPTRTGYIFAGWYSNPALTTAFSFSTPITDNITLYAKWTSAVPITYYTVIFKSNGGSAVSSQHVAYNGTATEPAAPTRKGYTFAGWYSNATLKTSFIFSTPITRNTTLYAKWTINHTVLFKSNGGSAVASQIVPHNSTATKPAAPTKTDHIFAGWYSNSALTKTFNFSTPITRNTTLYAKWVATAHIVTFKSNGGSAVASQHVAYNSTVTEPAEPTRKGYTFAGWYSNATLKKPFSFSTPITHNTTLYAKWTINHTVIFKSNGGGAVASQSVPHNSTATEPAAPTRTGYTFAGWYSNAALTTPFSFSTHITHNTTLYAKWTIILKNNYGSVGGSQHVVYNCIATESA